FLAPSFIYGDSVNLFTRYTLDARYYYPLLWGIVARAKLTAGYIHQWDDQHPVPISELYYLGGINSVRGYLLRSISPSLLAPSSSSPDAATQRLNVGGNKQLILNVELEFPILEKAGIRGVLFYDAGNAYSANENFFEDTQHHLPLGLFQSVGFGFRWFSPVGPLRFEWGIPITKRPEDQPIQFEFTIGNFF
ncbi:MAG: BamA/TamA family outer membrane protein, partial [Archangium sp.]